MIKPKALLFSIFIHLLVSLSLLVLFRLNGQAPAKYIEINLSLSYLTRIQTNSFKKSSKSRSKKNINAIQKKEKAKKEKEKVLKEPVVSNFIKEPKKEQKVDKIPDKVIKNYVKNENKETAEKEKGDKEKGGQNIGMIKKETQGEGNTGVYEGKIGEGEEEGGGLNLDKEREKKFLLEKLYIISKIVQKNISYPYIARKMGWEGRVVVSFVLTKEGKINLLTVEKSSGYDVLDENAIKTIKKVSKYFPLPPLDVKIKLPISYKLD
ncbi:MAG: energy transducer TonB [Thermodesulfobacterium sp.]|nr:energy transducer TonB [Thermodesulfobacterium sp.]